MSKLFKMIPVRISALQLTRAKETANVVRCELTCRVAALSCPRRRWWGRVPRCPEEQRRQQSPDRAPRQTHSTTQQDVYWPNPSAASGRVQRQRLEGVGRGRRGGRRREEASSPEVKVQQEIKRRNSPGDEKGLGLDMMQTGSHMWRERRGRW